MTEPEPLEQVDRTYVLSRNRKLSYFAGCDYFRLASHPEVLKSARAKRRSNLNVAASRLTTGNHVVYRQLEQSLADFFDTEDALLVSTGYLSSLIAAQSLAGDFSHALIDDRSHPALIDAARFLDCPVLQFRSQDPDALAGCVNRCGPGAKILLMTDGMFSRDGSTAPLDKYLKILPRDALILIDDAHGAGVLGDTGKGTPEYAGVSGRRIIQAITLSKAFGTFGGAVLGTGALRRRIITKSRAFTSSTPIPLPVAYAALESLRIMKRDGRELRKQLFDNSCFVKNSLKTAGIPIIEAPGPIIPLVPESKAQVERLKRSLCDAGIYPSFIHYSNGPASGYFRFVISSEHKPAQLQALVTTLKQFCLPRK